MSRIAPFTLVLCLLGCSSETDDTSRQLSRVEGFCSKWAEQACNDSVVDRCSAADADSCRQAQAAFCEEIVPSGKYSADHAEACLEAVQLAYEDAELTADERDLVRFLGGACHPVVSGSGSEGDPCEVTADCSVEADLSCVRKVGETMGTCQVAEEVGGGQRCSGERQVCAPGFYCNGQNCLAALEAGEVCSEDVPCADAFKCEATEGAVPGSDAGAVDRVCIERLGVGEICDKNDDCLSDICAMGAADGVCSPKIVLSATEPICADLR